MSTKVSQERVKVKTMTTTERNVNLRVQCHICNDIITLQVAEDDAYEYLASPNRRLIQDIFPYLTPSERELLVSHTCEKCWNDMFGDEEDCEITAEDLKEWQDASCGRV